MKKITVTVLLALVVLGTAACGGDPAEQGVQLMEKMADIFEKNQADCDKLGNELSAFIKDHDADFKKLKEYGDKQTPEQKKAFDEKYKTRVQAAVTKMMGGAIKCGNNPKVTEAMKSMPMK